MKLARLSCVGTTLAGWAASLDADETYIVPISYRYHDGYVYFACLPGQKLRYLKEHPTGVCLEVEEVDEAEWSTVIVTGTAGAPSGWEQVQEGFPTMRRVTRGPLRSHFSASTSPDAMGDLVMCVLRPTKIAGRKDRWVSVIIPPQPATPADHPLAGHLAG